MRRLFAKCYRALAAKYEGEVSLPDGSGIGDGAHIFGLSQGCVRFAPQADACRSGRSASRLEQQRLQGRDLHHSRVLSVQILQEMLRKRAAKRLVGALMWTPRRFTWLKSLLSLILLIGLSTPTPAEDDGIPDMSVVEMAFWICLQDHEATITENGAQCCDGAACYTCFRDFSECWISNDTSSSSSQRTGLESLRPHIRPMQERPSEGQLQSICTSVKANFTKFEGFGYSCLKPSCNGKGEYCAIICHTDSCTAQTPDVLRGAASLRGILQNGDNIDRNNSSSATESQGGGGGGDEDDDEEDPCYGCLY